MAYEVTATRKRPQVFEKLVGQEFISSTLEHAIEQNRIAHAYLFSGPRGVGKTTSARLLAKALNCEKGPTAHPCGECSSCQEISSGSSVDVIEIDGASNTSVNDIRDIKEEVLFPPQASRYKIYIIDEVHMLSTSAFNALLKTIEEPPEYIIFIFATTEIQKVPATIRSRCQQFHFQLISMDDIKSCLKEAADDLNVEADDDALFWIAREATGSMRDAYTLFDQVVAFSENHITLEKIKSKLGIIGIDNISNIVRLTLKGESANAVLALSELYKKGVSTEQCIRDYIDFFRTLLLLKEGVKSEEVLSHRPEQIPNDLIAAYTEEQLETVLRSLFNLYRDIRYSINPRFELELFTARLQRLPYLTTGEDLVMRLKEMKTAITEGKVIVKKEKQIIHATQLEAPVANKAVEAVAVTPTAPVKKVEEVAVTPETPITKLEEKVEPEPIPQAPTPVEKHTFNDDDFKMIKALPDVPMDITLALPSLVTYSINDSGNILKLFTTSTFTKTLLDSKLDVLKASIKEHCGFAGTVQFEVTNATLKDEKKLPKMAALLVEKFEGTFIEKEEKKTNSSEY